MATVTLGNLVPASQLAAAAATLYTAGAGETAVIHAVTATNTTAGAQTITLHIVPSGGSVADSNMVLKTRSVPANSTISISDIINQSIPPGATLRGFASAATSITLMVSGMVRAQ